MRGQSCRLLQVSVLLIRACRGHFEYLEPEDLDELFGGRREQVDLVDHLGHRLLSLVDEIGCREQVLFVRAVGLGSVLLGGKTLLDHLLQL